MVCMQTVEIKKRTYFEGEFVFDYFRLWMYRGQLEKSINIEYNVNCIK